MKHHILSWLGGFVAGYISTYLCLLCIAPMGGSRMSISVLPIIVGVALVGGLSVQSFLLSKLKSS